MQQQQLCAANALNLTCFTSLLANAACKVQATNTATSQQQARCCAGDIGTVLVHNCRGDGNSIAFRATP